MRNEMLHRTQQIETKPPTLRLRATYLAAGQHFCEKRMTHVPRRIGVAQHTAQISHDWLIVGITQIRKRIPSVFRIGLCQAHTGPPRRKKRR